MTSDVDQVPRIQAYPPGQRISEQGDERTHKNGWRLLRTRMAAPPPNTGGRMDDGRTHQDGWRHLRKDGCSSIHETRRILRTILFQAKASYTHTHEISNVKAYHSSSPASHKQGVPSRIRAMIGGQRTTTTDGGTPVRMAAPPYTK